MGLLTYIAGGLLICAFFGGLTNQPFSWMALACAALGSMAPDWIEQQWLTDRFGSKTITHSLLGLTMSGILLAPLFLTHHPWLAMSFLLGYTTHLFLDAATPQGVLLFYPHRARAVIPRSVLSRIEPGSRRERLLLRWLVGLGLMALWFNTIGIRRLLHQCLPVIQFAVEDYVTFSSQGRRVFVEFTGRFNASQRPISGRWEVLDTTSSTSLLVEDAQGTRYTLGSHPHDTILVFQARVKVGPKAHVILRSVHLENQVLSDALAYIPSEGNTYIIGIVHHTEPVSIPLPIDQFETFHAGPEHLEFHYATLRDLQEQHLTDLHVTNGELLLRTITEDSTGQGSLSMISTPSSARPHKILTLTIAHLHDPQELLIHPDQEVLQDQLLADLTSYRRELQTKHDAANAQLVKARAALAHEDLNSQHEMALKHMEDDLMDISRDLSSFKAQQLQALHAVRAAVAIAPSRLDLLDHELASTTIASPVAGRLISIRFLASTAILQIVADD